MRRIVAPVMVFACLIVALTVLRGGAVTHRIGSPPDGRLEKSDAEWRAVLTPEQYRICRAGGTERAYAGEYWNTKAAGTYDCRCCGQALFASDNKYDSGTGWPSFSAPVDENNVSLISDRSWIMERTEVKCSRCDAHVGHLFGDGPAPSGTRYCMNSAALKFVARD